jgi:AcrR family transcriptional regulator
VTVAEVDGRNARRDRNRDLVLDAALELFREGTVEPNAIDIAIRSGVSERSVFRYFPDRDALVHAAIDRHLEKTLPLFVIDRVGEGPLADRIDRFVAHRLTLYRTLAPTARVAVVRASTNPVIGELLERSRQRLRDGFTAMFARELRALPAAQRRTVVAVGDTLVQFEAVEHIVQRLGLSERQAASALRHALTSLLAA